MLSPGFPRGSLTRAPLPTPHPESSPHHPHPRPVSSSAPPPPPSCLSLTDAPRDRIPREIVLLLQKESAREARCPPIPPTGGSGQAGGAQHDPDGGPQGPAWSPPSCPDHCLCPWETWGSPSRLQSSSSPQGLFGNSVPFRPSDPPEYFQEMAHWACTVQSKCGKNIKSKTPD